MTKQYSFILTEQRIQEGKGLRKLALGLGLLGGSIGLARAPLPQAVRDVHPEYGNTFGSGMTYELVHHKSKPINFTDNFTKGFRSGMNAFMPPEIKHAKEVGDGLTQVIKDKDHNEHGGSSFTNGFIVGKKVGD